MKPLKKNRNWVGIDISYIPLVFGAALTVGIVYLVYIQTQDLLKERLRERITAIVSTASLQIKVDDILAITNDYETLSEELQPIIDSATESFSEKKILEQIMQNNFLNNHPIVEVTNNLKRIRAANTNLKYIYLLELTDRAGQARFITDSDTLIPVDWNNNQLIDEIEYPPLPGEEYDISDISDLQIAVDTPIAINELYSDKWGTFLSGYAPIKDQNGNTVAILAADVQVDDFNQVIRATLLPFFSLAVVLLSMLLIQTISLVKIWANRVEIVKEIDRQKDELLSIVSHQLATPVASAKWYLEMLIDGDVGKLNKSQSEHVRSTQTIVENMSDLVSMILDVSRIQLGRMKVEQQSTSLKDFFSSIEEVIKPKAQEKNIEYKSILPNQLPNATIDKRLTRMTIENLLSNAIKYTPENGKVSLEVKIKHGKLECKISDNGLGIPKKDQDRIFTKLYRASNVRNSIDGNGFGLYIAKGAIESQGGKIWFESLESKGTAFYVELPIKGLI